MIHRVNYPSTYTWAYLTRSLLSRLYTTFVRCSIFSSSKLSASHFTRYESVYFLPHTIIIKARPLRKLIL